MHLLPSRTAHVVAWCFLLVPLATWQVAGSQAAESQGAESQGAESPVVIEAARVSLIGDVQVPALEAGVLVELRVREGDQVQRGQVLGRLDSTLAEHELQAANLQQQIADVQARNDVNLRYAEKSYEVAEADVVRAQQAVREFERSISSAEMDQLRLIAERSRLAREQSELEMQSARLTSQLRAQESAIAARRLEQRQIVAPLDGVVIEVFPHPGEWLQPGDPVVRVIQTDRMRIEAFVDGYRFGPELIGRPVTFTSRVPPGETTSQWQGSVRFVSPVMQPVTGEVRLLADVKNTDGRLRAGMVGNLTLEPHRSR